jgi:uncharacterized protein
MKRKNRRPMKTGRILAALLFAIAFLSVPLSAQAKTKHVLAFYSATVERDHVVFAEMAVKFFAADAKVHGYEFSSTTNWNDLNVAQLKDVQVMLWLNDSPHTPSQRAAFENYMEHGGGWMGFHAAAYNDESTGWLWFVNFLGGTVFFGNNWPPAVKVFLTLAPSNYPLGLKDTIEAGDVPVVWSNKHYRMIYMNMGHGDKIFDSTEQNRCFEDALASLLATSR